MVRFRLAARRQRGPGDQRMAIESKAARLRLLRQHGRLGRSMQHGGIRYWIGHHRELELLIFDPHAQREVETGKVRLFSVTDRESRLFMLDMARTRSHWSSPDSHVERCGGPSPSTAEPESASERRTATVAGATSTPWTSPSAGDAAGSRAPAGTAAAATGASRRAALTGIEVDLPAVQRTTRQGRPSCDR